MIELFNEKKDCCGCTACKSICPKQSITMKLDKEGFLYPHINESLCIGCGLCKSVCPLTNEVIDKERIEQPLVYALRHKSEKIRMTSSSGGAYTAISDYALNTSCIIYGVEFTKDFMVQHKGTTNEVGRDKFKGSKYVQSDLGKVFNEINENLKNDKAVLFSGTPCQVAGLKKYLEKTNIKTNKLILNDIICHGTPSRLLWNDYLNFIQKRSKLKSFTFRFKQKGWRGYNIKAEFEDGKVKINTSDIKIFSNIFCTDLALRPSCYHCKFANLQRSSDITIADFWGIENSLPKLDDNKGVSLIIISTKKGEKIFDKIKNETECVQSNISDCLQNNLLQPTKCPINREQFWQEYQKFGFDFISKKYGNYSLKDRVKKTVVILLKKLGLYDFVRKSIRK